jgi:hypothetical protein
LYNDDFLDFKIDLRAGVYNLSEEEFKSLLYLFVIEFEILDVFIDDDGDDATDEKVDCKLGSDNLKGIE